MRCPNERDCEFRTRAFMIRMSDRSHATSASIEVRKAAYSFVTSIFILASAHTPVTNAITDVLKVRDSLYTSVLILVSVHTPVIIAIIEAQRTAISRRTKESILATGVRLPATNASIGAQQTTL